MAQRQIDPELTQRFDNDQRTVQVRTVPGKRGCDLGQEAAASNTSLRFPGRTSVSSTSAADLRCTSSRGTVRDQLSRDAPVNTPTELSI